MDRFHFWSRPQRRLLHENLLLFLSCWACHALGELALERLAYGRIECQAAESALDPVPEGLAMRRGGAVPLMDRAQIPDDLLTGTSVHAHAPHQFGIAERIRIPPKAAVFPPDEHTCSSVQHRSISQGGKEGHA